MAGVHVGHRLVFAGSSSFSAGSGTLVNLKSNLRFLHVGRRFTNWKKATGSQQIKGDGGFAVAGCTVPILQG